MLNKQRESELNRYRLRVPGGVYEHSSLFLLILSVLKHRFSHLIKDGKWMD
jgi:hypothetical protein